jgi:putative flippase GtrA
MYPEIPVLIPAYQPGDSLVTVVADLLKLGVQAIVVVNDGSGPEFDDRFRTVAEFPGVIVVHHAVNLGKGAALKTGMNCVLVHFPNCIGVVTADADGQHHAEDIVRVAERLREDRDTLVMGVRTFDERVPWKSRIGNKFTRALVRLTVGQNLSDSQTGLRGIPSAMIAHLLRVPTSGYEFELDMLMAVKHQGCRIAQVPIRTIYVDNNRSSHFRPILDSMRIYVLLLRFSVLSLMTAALDNVIFVLAFSATGSIGQSQIAGRFVAMIFNYLGARSVVFQSRQKHAHVFPKYALLVVCNGLLSYALIQLLHFRAGLSPISAKLIAEAILFIANFAVQRDFVFTRTRQETANRRTNWDKYYTRVPFTAKLTRRHSTAVLLDAIKRHGVAAAQTGEERLSVIEVGGANSCFMDAILAKNRCGSYHVVDTNRYGLSLLEQRVGPSEVVRLHEQSVLDMSLNVEADIVFSVGLVEHFDPVETRRAILAHFDVLRPGGIAIITFPTPTLLYRTARRLLETFGMWKFPDERPLRLNEVAAAVGERGNVLEFKIMWPLILTQQVIVASKVAA